MLFQAQGFVKQKMGHGQNEDKMMKFQSMVFTQSHEFLAKMPE